MKSLIDYNKVMSWI